MRQVFVVLALLLAQGAWSMAPVEIVGLFKDRAVVRIPGGEVMLKVGQTKDGVTLLAADANRAVVRYQDRRYELGLSNRVAGNYQRVEQVQLVVAADRMGQYQVQGAVNNRFTSFLVDTGASVVAMSSELAQRMNIDYLAGKRGAVQTAQGRTPSFFVTLDEVVVGGLKAYNVEAAVIEGEFPRVPLLGMSFLRQVSMEESAGVLTLTQTPR